MKSKQTLKTNSIEGEKAPAEEGKEASSEDLGFSQNDLDAIMLSESADFQHRLWSAEKQLAPLPVEVAFLFSVDGVELGRAIGTAKRIVLTDEQCELVCGGILTHNHPDGSFFSWEDIRLAHSLNLTEIRAVRQGSPVWVLSMHRPLSGWKSAERFEALVGEEEKENATQVIDNLNMSGLNVSSFSDKDLKGIVDKKWPAYFQARLRPLGYPYESRLLQEPTQ